jgi:citrate synthase
MAHPNRSQSDASPEVAEGLAGVLAGRTAISSLDGRLRYRGYAVEDLAAGGDYEETAYLLLHGELPDAAERRAFVERLDAAADSIDAAVYESLAVLARREPAASPMDALRTAASCLGQIDRDAGGGSAADRLLLAERLLGRMPAILAAWMDMASGRPLAAWPGGGITRPLLARLLGREPDQPRIRVFGTTLVLYAEHEFNASTFAARTVVSTGSDMHSGLCAAIGALKGPLHGGANEQVLDQLAEIGSVERAASWVAERLAAKRVVMGFGHRVYKDGDERARLLGGLCRTLVQDDAGARLEEMAAIVETEMLRAKGLRPNLDWPAARVYHALGLPVKVFTPIFVVARTAGWAAHMMEQMADNRLIRPSAAYRGPAARDYRAPESREAPAV